MQALYQYWHKPQAALARDIMSTPRLLWRQLAVLLGAGVPLVCAIEQVRAQRIAHSHAADHAVRVLDQWHLGLADGARFAQLAQPWLSDDEASLLMVGEANDALAPALLAVDQLRRLRQGQQASWRRSQLMLLTLSLLAAALVVLQLLTPWAAWLPRSAAALGWGGAAAAIDSAVVLVLTLPLASTALLVLLASAGAACSDYRQVSRWCRAMSLVQARQMQDCAAWLASMAAMFKLGCSMRGAAELAALGAPDWLASRVDATLSALAQGANVPDAIDAAGLILPRAVLDDWHSHVHAFGAPLALAILAQRVNERAEQAMRLWRHLLGGCASLLALLLLLCQVLAAGVAVVGA